MAEALDVVEMTAWYGRARALKSVNIYVERGQVVALFGHNGAGKSTLLRSIMRLHRQTTGRISLSGQALEGLLAHEVARRGVAIVREGGPVFETMTVAEHLALGGRLQRRSGNKRSGEADPLTAFPMLRDFLDVKAGFLSGGQRQALAIATALASGPRYLLLDEPSTGLAASVARSLYESIAQLAESGMALLIAEQNPRWLTPIANTGYLLENGEIAVEGPPREWLGSMSQN